MKQEFDRILDFYTTNRLVYENLLRDAKKQRVIPFAGRNSSDIFFGSMWEFIKEICQKTGIEELIEDSYTSILEKLANRIDYNLLVERLIDYYDEEKIDDRLLMNHPISLIPYINEKQCITTIIDCAIEHSYRLAGIDAETAHPNQTRKFLRLIRGNSESIFERILFKLHGDISSQKQDMVLTESDYRRHYSKRSALTKNLKIWCSSFSILFFGMNVLHEKYIWDFLKDISEEGIHHYAIVEIENDEQAKRAMYETLLQAGIYAIIVDDSKAYASDMIIHKLLVDIRRIPNYPYREYDYHYSHQDMIGRDKQIEMLKHFLYQDTEFSWTIIRGDRFTGRTKLLYDFSRLYATEWEWYIIDPEEIDIFLAEQARIQSARKRARKVLVIFDNFHWYRGSVNKLFEENALNNYEAVTTRYVFVLYDLKSSAFSKEKEKYKNNNSNNVGYRRMILSLDRTNPLIELGKLTIDEVYEICVGYIWYRSYELEIENEVERCIDLIKQELMEYIAVLMRNRDPNILYLSQMKAVSLINQIKGEESASDVDIIEELFRMSISAMSDMKDKVHSQSFNASQWVKDKFNEYAGFEETKEYFNNQAKDRDKKTDDYITDNVSILEAIVNDNQHSSDNPGRSAKTDV